MLRQPRAYLIVEDVTLPATSIDVNLSKTHKSDTFHAEVPFGALPPGMDERWWSEKSNISVQVFISMTADGVGVKRFDGKVDQVGHDFARRVLTIQGRDKSAELIDNKAQKKFNNKSPDQVVKELASDHGVEVDADAVGKKAGKLFQIDYAKIAQGGSTWTVINRLADENGMVAYMTGGKLYFKPFDEKLPVYKLVYVPPTPESAANGNFMTPTTSRNVILGRPVKVKVSSWNHKENKAYSSEQTESKGTGSPLIYNYEAPGMTGDQVEKLAKKRLAENTSHELSYTLNIPGDTALTPRVDLELSGTNTAYDQRHEITTIQETISQDGGYRMTVSGKAKSKKRGK